MLDIEIKSIPHDKHRYPTVGDYFEENGIEKYRVSNMSDRRREILVIIHEMIENELRKMDGIREEDITAFDVSFESKREQRLLKAKTEEEKEAILDEEPGDQPEAPYFKHHQIATGVERLLAALLSVDWNDYDHEVMHL